MCTEHTVLYCTLSVLSSPLKPSFFGPREYKLNYSIQEPVSIEVCATLFKKEAYRGIHPPKYYGFEIPNKFVVGYGLDYDQHGRNLSAIYQVKS